VLQIHDRFWPYQRQQTPERSLEPETEFVERVRALFLAPACVQASFSAADEKLALGMHRRASPWNRSLEPSCLDVPQVCRHAQCRKPNPITSLQYFADIVEEVSESAIPESYWERFARRSRAWSSSGCTPIHRASEALTRGRPSAAPHHQDNGPHHHHAGPHPTEPY